MAEATAHQENEATVPEAAERVVVAFRDVLESRLDLALLEARVRASRAVQAGLLGAGAAVLALVSWLGALAAAGMLLARAMDPAAAVAVVTGVNAAVAGALAWAARYRGSPGEEAT